MPIKLIVTDLDGTLLNKDKLISKVNIQTFQLAEKNGAKATIATGRMHCAAVFFGKTVGVKVPVISCNGAMIRGINNDEVIFEDYIDNTVTEEILSYLLSNNIYCSWYIGTERYAPYFSWDKFSGYRTVKDFSVTEVGNNYKDYTKNVTQIVLRSSEKALPHDIILYLQEKYSKVVKLQQNTGCTIDITPPNINKAIGVKYLAEYLDIDKSEIFTLGDGDNDVDMLRYAGSSAAMGNGIGAAKKAAAFVTDTCDNDGVAKAIKKVLNL